MTRLYGVILSCSLVGGIGACTSDGSDPDNNNNNNNGGPDAGTTVTPDAAPTWDFFVDQNGIHGAPNLDDDDGVSARDWFQPPFAADDDYVKFVLPAKTLDLVPAGGSVQLSLTGDVSMVRVFKGTQHILGAEKGASTMHVFTPAGADEEFLVEFGNYGVSVPLQIQARGPSGDVLHTATTKLMSSPLIMNHHLQPAEQIWMVSYNAENAAMATSFKNALGTKFTLVPGSSVGYDVWFQDEFEFATTTGDNGQRIDITIDSIRDRGLQAYSNAGNWRKPDSYAQTWGNPNFANSYDSFGNLEASPPVEVGGVKYPFGKIFYGRVGTAGLNTTLGTFLANQRVQAPFQLPTSWLCVGHVDEFSTFVPDPSSPKGFKLVIADVPSAYALLQTLNPAQTLPKYGADHGYSTIGAIVNDSALRSLNNSLQSTYLTPITNTLKAQLGLTDADIIKLPSLFETVSDCGGGVAALIPGMTNLQIAQVDGTTHLFTADPFFRSVVSQASDPIITAFKNLMPAGMTMHFVDDWDVYHMGLGEVHCGTNVRRTPKETWWTAASHLMGGN